jgi:hypothetical protein
MAELTTAWMLGCVCGFFMGVTVAGRRRPTCRELMSLPRDLDPDWRRSFSHENINRPTSEPPLRFRRSGDGYRPNPSRPGANPPPRNP